MKRIFLIFLSIFFVFTTSVFGEILDKHGKIKPEVVKLFELFSPYIKKNSDFDIDDAIRNPDLSVFNDIAQKLFLRPDKSERMSQESIEHYHNMTQDLSPEQIIKVLNLTDEIGFFADIFPKYKKYDYILIQGSTVKNMRERVMFLANLVKKNKINVDKSHILFLTGERKLFTSENEAVLRDPSPYKISRDFVMPDILPEDEPRAAKFVWNQLSLPTKLRNKQIVFIEAAKQGGAKRATTADVALKWISDSEVKSGLCLIISSNPFVFYQKRATELATLRSREKVQLEFDAAGPSVQHFKYSEIELIGVLMDNLARVLYIEREFMK
jgi:hypothetical protein